MLRKAGEDGQESQAGPMGLGRMCTGRRVLSTSCWSDTLSWCPRAGRTMYRQNKVGKHCSRTGRPNSQRIAKAWHMPGPALPPNPLSSGSMPIGGQVWGEQGHCHWKEDSKERPSVAEEETTPGPEQWIPQAPCEGGLGPGNTCSGLRNHASPPTSIPQRHCLAGPEDGV